MKALFHDMISAILLGILLPGVILNTAVALQSLRAQSELVATTAPVEILEPSTPIWLRTADGNRKEQELEEYLIGVVLAEMPASFESEALKAQAVAARTYTQKAVKTGGKHGDGSVCTDPSCCQAYLSPEAYLEKGGSQESLEKVRSAVQETAGQCLYYEGELIEATYFSCSGGRTEEAVAVWGTAFPYLLSVDSPGEENAAYFTDSVTFSVEELEKRLGLEMTNDPADWFEAITYTAGGGVDTMEICGKTYTGTQLRSHLGLRSTAFTVDISGDVVTFTTRGYGHRVGMSQYGADAMAVQGRTYREILVHYYPGTEIKDIG